jgi:glycosyltransferase involved in cell wall biosynthesis
MHTNPTDPEGPNLLSTMGMLGLNENVFFSTQSIDFSQMNVLHNIADFCINIALNEGFGLATLESMQAGKPIIATKTGGLTRQVVDHRDGSENGFALEPDVKSLVGSQMVPYIYEDYVQNEKVSDAIYKMYKLGPEGRKNLGNKARSYVQSEFNIKDTIDRWHETLWDLTEKWQKDRDSIYKSWELTEF